jgi:5'-nucleotidase
MDMEIVLTNDDGFDAPGILALAEALSGLASVRVVAPAEAQSGVGHRVTTRDPIRVRTGEDGRTIVHGTPADCVRISAKRLYPHADWVIAGINPGANLGSDVYQSGTVAAAREAAILGFPAMAVSQYIAKDAAIDWSETGAMVRRVVRRMLPLPLSRGFFWNVNLPSPLSADTPAEPVFCGLDTFPHRYGYRRQGDSYVYEGIIHERPRAPGKDVAVCFGGRVSATRIALATLGFPGRSERS